LPDPATLQSAINGAIAFLADAREPQALLWLEQMHRRFGIAEFAGSLRLFDERLADLSNLNNQSDQAPRLRLLRRIADPGTGLNLADLDYVSHTSDRIVIAALYSDQLDPPPFYPDVLREAVAQGGYYATHALLAWSWIRELGGRLALPADFVADLMTVNAAIVNHEPGSVTDLKLEAAAFLYLAGEGARVAYVFLEAVVRTQNADGGWGMTRANPGVSDWHGTVLAILLLLQASQALAC
jgi:hypothetical protein